MAAPKKSRPMERRPGTEPVPRAPRPVTGNSAQAKDFQKVVAAAVPKTPKQSRKQMRKSINTLIVDRVPASLKPKKRAAGASIRRRAI